MKLVAITRLRNEEDILEAFVRHHATWLDGHIFVDNGSTDGSPRILQALRREGLPILLYQNGSAASVESVFTTLMYRVASRDLEADWVIPLDCDEFLTVDGGVSLERVFAGVDRAVACLRLPVLRYVGASPATAGQLNVVQRLVRRRPDADEFGKVCLRGGLADVIIGHGQHSVMMGGHIGEGMPQDRIVLAHFPERAPLQVAAKVVRGWLQVVATGETAVASAWAQHYTEPFAQLTRDLGGWLAATQARLDAAMVAADLIDDPIAYRGGSLRHTAPVDERMRAMASLIGTADALARMLGRAQDMSADVANDIARQAAAMRRVF